MATDPLPEGWTEGVDPTGRKFYCNHVAKITQWQRPAAGEVPPPSYSHVAEQPPLQTGAQTSSAYQEMPRGAGSDGAPVCVCTPRLTFWMTSGLGWIVWIFAVSAAADDSWYENWSFSAGDETVLRMCGDNVFWDREGFCEKFKAFTAMQFLATIFCSVAMVLLMVAFVRPASGQCCGGLHLNVAGCVLMGMFTFFQMIAFILIPVIDKNIYEGYLTEGSTFGVAIVGFLFGLAVTVTLGWLMNQSGDGPLYPIVHECLVKGNFGNTNAPRTSVSHPSHEGAAAGGAPVPAPPMPSAPNADPDARSAAPPSNADAGARSTAPPSAPPANTEDDVDGDVAAETADAGARSVAPPSAPPANTEDGVDGDVAAETSV